MKREEEPFRRGREPMIAPAPTMQLSQQLPQQLPPHLPDMYTQQLGGNAIGNRQLNVKDALSYLDQVKMQFSEQPEVYNQFLDIMKEFKSQSIDTPGVINRVATLFQGHNNLIQGFNTFLPPGFKIDVNDEVITTTTPDQMSTQFLNPQNALQPPRHFPSPPPQNQTPPPQTQPFAHNAQSNIISAQGSTVRKQPVEFDHAINYVNKIKTRFQTQPEIYKSFLDILHVYQKEQKTIKEVYDQVASLFRSHPDLLEEFTQFLPEAGAHQQQMNQANQSLSMSNHIPPPSAPASAEHFMQPSKKSGNGTKSGSRQYKRGSSSPTKLSPNQPPIKKQKVSNKTSPIPPIPQYQTLPTTQSNKMELTNEIKQKEKNFEEIEYFDKIKRTLNNKTAYAEFLKCLKLFNLEIITKQELVQLTQNFLGKTDLMEWFKQFVGYKDPIPDKIAPIENLPVINFEQCRKYGSSYREVPKDPKCSGKTDLCDEVLNNVWVSFPIWSEDAPFLASKKNQYEEIIYRADDERYELHRVIELNATTIRVFEPIHKKIQSMTAEEAQKFRLPNNLGGTSEVLYHVALKRIYGERYQEVVDGLKRHPAVAIPVVLNRLKQKDEEWRKAQRDWNKIWADIYAKNFYRSLDYQGVNIKNNDKKNFTQKALVQEAEQLLSEQNGEPDGVNNTLKYHFEYYFRDSSLFNDLKKLLLFYAEKTSNLSQAERGKIIDFCYFLLDFFFQNGDQKQHKLENQDETMNHEIDSITNPQNHQSNEAQKVETNNVENHVSQNGPVENKNSNHVSDQKPTDMELDKENDTRQGKVKSLVIHEENEKGEEKMEVDSTPKCESHDIYGNGSIFCLFRLFQMAYQRLEKIKELAAQAKNNDNRFGQVSKVATNLGLSSPPLHEYTVDQYYAGCLDLLEQFIEGKIEQTKFEDIVRQMFGIDSYVLFSYDKLIHSIGKQIQGFTQDEKNEYLFSAYQRETNKPEAIRLLEEQNYKTFVESITDEIFYKIVYNNTLQQLTIQVIPKNEGKSKNSLEEKWSRYVLQYMKMETTDDNAPKSVVFLPRNKRLIKNKNFDFNSLEIVNNLECKICINTYKMFFVENSEDYFYRKDESLSPEKLKLNQKSKREKFSQFLKSKSKAEALEKKCLDWFLENGTTQIEVDNGEIKYFKYITQSQA